MFLTTRTFAWMFLMFDRRLCEVGRLDRRISLFPVRVIGNDERKETSWRQAIVGGWKWGKASTQGQSFRAKGKEWRKISIGKHCSRRGFFVSSPHRESSTDGSRY